MSLQIKVPQVVGAWLTVPQTQPNNFMHFSRLLNLCSLEQILFARNNGFVTIANLYFETSKSFSGIVYAHQQMASSIGDCVRDLEIIAQTCMIEEFINHIGYLPL